MNEETELIQATTDALESVSSQLTRIEARLIALEFGIALLVRTSPSTIDIDSYLQSLEDLKEFIEEDTMDEDEEDSVTPYFAKSLVEGIESLKDTVEIMKERELDE